MGNEPASPAQTLRVYCQILNKDASMYTHNSAHHITYHMYDRVQHIVVLYFVDRNQS